MRALVTMTWNPLVFVLLIVVTVGCKSAGSGIGESATGDVQARFTWQQSDPLSGTLTAMVSGQNDSETYTGKFYQITRNSRIDTLGPLWHPWHPGWRGRPDGKRMRCEFQLLRADEGMKAGGEDRCQLPSGKTIKADFPPS